MVADSVGSAQEVIDNMEPIEDYIDKNPDVYFGCKALNYRSKKNKIEGNRALSVQIDYKVIDEALEVDIEYEKPLKRSGKETNR